jgi:hypothetical protein
MLNIQRACVKMVCAAIVLALWLGVPDASRASTPAVFRVHWRMVASNVSQFASNGRYVFFDTTSLPQSETDGTLIDDQTGKRSSIPGCADPLFGGPWLALNCAGSGPGQLRLYQLATGRWRIVNLFCNSSEPTYIYDCSPIAIGANWIAVAYGPVCYHCILSEAAQNVWTGQTTSFPPTYPGGKQAIDLNSTTLVRTLCQPVRVPIFIPTSTEINDVRHRVTFYGSAPVASVNPPPGSLTFYGRFAVAYGNRSAYLVRCGSRLHVPLPPGLIPIDESRQMIAWQVLHGGLGGRMLPSLRRFRIPLAANIVHAYGVLVGVAQRNIYVQATVRKSGKYALWAATVGQVGRSLDGSMRYFVPVLRRAQTARTSG